MRPSSPQGFTLVELLVIMGIISVLASLSVWGLSGQTAQIRHSEARAILAQISNKQESYMAQRGRYLTLGANPSGALPNDSERHDWNFQDKDWKALGVKPSRSRVFHQYTVFSGTGQRCTAMPGCGGIKGQSWWWARAQRGDATLYINSARNEPWVVEE